MIGSAGIFLFEICPYYLRIPISINTFGPVEPGPDEGRTRTDSANQVLALVKEPVDRRSRRRSRICSAAASDVMSPVLVLTVS